MRPLLPLLLMVFFAIFSVVVIGLIIALARRRGGNGSGGVSAQSSSSRAGLVSTVSVSIAPDGFWLRSAAVAAGMFVGYRYLVASGGRTSQVQFVPGPDGHFVFTGERPDHVEITHVTSAESGIDRSVVVSDTGSTYSRDLLTAETWSQTHRRDDDSPPPFPTSSTFEPPAPPAY